MHISQARQRSPLMWVCLLAALLSSMLWAQSLGLVHRVMHGSAAISHAQSPSHAVSSTANDIEGASALHAGGLGAWTHLWSDAQTADCLSYDQLALGLNFSPPPLLGAFALPTRIGSAVQLDARRVNLALFDARGPPALL